MRHLMVDLGTPLYLKILNLSSNFFCCTNVRQSINNSANSNNKLPANPIKDCHDKTFDSSVFKFSEANFPMDNAMVSLVNLPIKKAGIM